ncbi:MAG: hypothetical protein EU535_08965 [Promethearchaeota archaeon]|nr:MAG: hypothetical protein EU535_08965 [Candidatus Lokiarchaeota archaeon]
MAFKDLKLLLEKENRIFLILVIWVIIGYILYQFLPFIVGAIIFLPLIVLCVFLFFAAMTSRKKISEISKLRWILNAILTIIFINAFIFLGFVLLILALLSYILITTIFTMNSFLNLGLSLDQKIEKLPSKLKKFDRWGILVGGIVGSIVLIITTGAVLEVLMGKDFNPIVPSIAISLVIAFLGIIGIYVANHKGKLNAWLGIFCIWVAIYSVYLLYSVLSDLTSDEASTGYSRIITLLLFFFNLFILVYSISGLIGPKAQIIKEKLKFIGADTLLIWLIFAIASYEFAKGLPTMDISLFKNIAVFVLFIPLTFLMGVYGIRNYEKILKKRNSPKKTSEPTTEVQ